MTTAIRFGPTALRRLLAAFICGWLGTSSVSAGDVRVSPPSVALTGPEASQQLLVALVGAGEPPVDLTRRARYEVAGPRVVSVDETGLVLPVAEGKAEI